MIEETVNRVINKRIGKDLQHILYPAIMVARIEKASQDGGWNCYSLRIFDKSNVIAEDIPVIPYVYAKEQYDTGAFVAVGLLYGELRPVILTEVREGS